MSFSYFRLHAEADLGIFPETLGDINIVYGGMGLPTFHAMGFMVQLAFPLATGREVAVFAPQDPASPVIPNAQNVFESSRMSECSAIFAPPSFIEVRINASVALRRRF